jgi:glycosyltransferase involved in cell wall biosynthesis
MTADTVGGVWTYAMDLARALGEEGVGVALATMGGLPSPDQRREARGIAMLDLYESEYRLPWMEQPWDDVLAAGVWLQELAARVGPDVVHVNEPVLAAWEFSVPVVAVAHSCVLSWWQSVWNVPAPASWNHYRDEMKRGLSHADAVVAPSAWMLHQLHRYYGIKGHEVIPNGREPGGSEPEIKGPVVFAAGRVWDPAKNLMALDQVADGLAWPVYVAGDARHPDGDAPVEAHHLHLLGKLSSIEVAAWLRQASIYAFPARYEPFGLSIVEAALAGCALVLGDLPTLREQWDGRAVFVPQDEPAMLRLAIESLIENPDLRYTLSMRARRHALTLNPRRMAGRYLKLYAELHAARKLHRKVPACAS